MIAGHILIALCVSFTNMLWTSMSLATPFSLFGVAMIAGCMCFEVFVAVLQAFVFAMLSASYIGSSVN
jgi:F-type H+-transporting ATPase subunit a